MSLISALNIGKSALAVQQAALQVTGNNISNAGNADYTRQVVGISPSPDQQIQPGMFMGTGVNLTSISRQVDEALQGRLQSANSDSSAANTQQTWLSQVEGTFNELTGNDLSTQLNTFFSSWSALANNPQDAGLRQSVITNGQNVASWMGNLRSQLTSLQGDANSQIGQLATQADQLAQQVADLNGQITTAEGGSGGTANGLRDQRDAVLTQLSQLVGIKTVTGDGPNIDVYVGSQPLVVGTLNNGLKLAQQTVNGQSQTAVVFKNTGATIDTSSGQLGALINVRDQQIGGVIKQVDQLAGTLTFEMNKVYSQGQGLQGYDNVTMSNSATDANAALNDPASGLAFAPQTGDLTIALIQKSTGAVASSASIHIDLDGLNGNDTSLNSLAASINSSLSGVTATVAGGRLTLKSNNPSQQITFGNDSSGTLAALGINTFFTGKDATDIAVNQSILDNHSLLAASSNGDAGDGGTALTLANFDTKKLDSLNGASLSDAYQGMVNQVAVSASSAKTNAQAASAVQQTLETQRQALSGVSIDEEAVNMLQEQRAFQGAARFVSAVDQMMQTILQMVT